MNNRGAPPEDVLIQCDECGDKHWWVAGDVRVYREYLGDKCNGSPVFNVECRVCVEERARDERRQARREANNHDLAQYNE